MTERRTKNVDLFWSRCGKHICPEHSDIVCINCDYFDITITIVIIFVCVHLQECSGFVLLFVFISKCFRGLCCYSCLFAIDLVVCVRRYLREAYK